MGTSGEVTLANLRIKDYFGYISVHLSGYSSVFLRSTGNNQEIPWHLQNLAFISHRRKKPKKY